MDSTDAPGTEDCTKNPFVASPQKTMVPSFLRATKYCSPESILTKPPPPGALDCTPPYAECPHVSMRPFELRAANAYLFEARAT